MEAIFFTTKLEELCSYYSSDTKSDDDIIYAVYDLVSKCHAVTKTLLLELRFEELHRCLDICWISLQEKHVTEGGRTVLRDLTGEDRRMVDSLLQRTQLLENQALEALENNKAQNIVSYTTQVIRNQMSAMSKLSAVKSGADADEGCGNTSNTKQSKEVPKPPKRGVAFGRSKVLRRWVGEDAVPRLVTYSHFSNPLMGQHRGAFSCTPESDDGGYTESLQHFSSCLLGDSTVTVGARPADEDLTPPSSGSLPPLAGVTCGRSSGFVHHLDENLGPTTAPSALLKPTTPACGEIHEKQGALVGTSVDSSGSYSGELSSFSSHASTMSEVWNSDTGKCIARIALAVRATAEEDGFATTAERNSEAVPTSFVPGARLRESSTLPRRLVEGVSDGASVCQEVTATHKGKEEGADVFSYLEGYDEGSAMSAGVAAGYSVAPTHGSEALTYLPPIRDDASSNISSQEAAEPGNEERSGAEGRVACGFPLDIASCARFSPEAVAQMLEVCENYKKGMVDIGVSMEAMRRKTEEHKDCLRRRETFVLKATNEWMKTQRVTNAATESSPDVAETGQLALPSLSEKPAEVAYKEACMSVSQRHLMSQGERRSSSILQGGRGGGSLAAGGSLLSLPNATEFLGASSKAYLSLFLPRDSVTNETGGGGAMGENTGKNSEVKPERFTSPIRVSSPRSPEGGVLTNAQLKLKRLRSLGSAPFHDVHRMVVERTEKLVELEQGTLYTQRLRTPSRTLTGEGSKLDTENSLSLSLSFARGNTLARCERVGSSFISTSLPSGMGSEEPILPLSWMKQNLGPLGATVRKNVLGIEPSSATNLVSVVRSSNAKIAPEDQHPTLFSSIEELQRRPNWVVVNTATLSMVAPFHLAVVRIQWALHRFIAIRELNRRKLAVQEYLRRSIMQEEFAIAVQRWGRWLISLRCVAGMWHRSNSRKKFSEQCVNCDVAAFTDASYEYVRKFSVAGSAGTALLSAATEPRIKSGSVIRWNSRRVTLGGPTHFSRLSVVHMPSGTASFSGQANGPQSPESSPVRRMRENDACRVIVRAFRACRRNKLRCWRREMENLLRFVTQKAPASEVFKDVRGRSHRHVQTCINGLDSSPRRSGVSEENALFPVSPDRVLGDTYAAWEARVAKSREEGNFLTPLSGVKLSELHCIYEQRLEIETLKRLKEQEAAIEAKEEEIKREEIEQSLLVLQPCLRGFLTRRRVAFRWKELRKGKLFSHRPARLINMNRSKTVGFDGGADGEQLACTKRPSLDPIHMEEHPIPLRVAEVIHQSIHQRNPLLFPLDDEGCKARFRLVLMMQAQLRQKESLLYVADRYIFVCATAIQRWWRLMKRLRGGAEKGKEALE